MRVKIIENRYWRLRPALCRRDKRQMKSGYVVVLVNGGFGCARCRQRWYG